MNIGNHTTRGNCDVRKELIQFLIVANGQLNMTGNDTLSLVVARGVTSQLENLCREVLEDSSEVDGCTSANTGRISSFTELTVDSTNRELNETTC